jgi:hypothetical protein
VAGSPLAFWWLDPSTVYALGLVLIAAIYVGFAVADGRPKVIVAESSVASVFVLVAAIAVTGSVWLIVVGLVGHGLKDLWQHRASSLPTPGGGPPFCVVTDWVAAGDHRHRRPSPYGWPHVGSLGTRMCSAPAAGILKVHGGQRESGDAARSRGRADRARA